MDELDGEILRIVGEGPAMVAEIADRTDLTMKNTRNRIRWLEAFRYVITAKKAGGKNGIFVVRITDKGMEALAGG